MTTSEPERLQASASPAAGAVGVSKRRAVRAAAATEAAQPRSLAAEFDSPAVAHASAEEQPRSPPADPFASDLALALMMQEQEQAHFLFAAGSLSEEAEDGSQAERSESAPFAEDDTSDEALAWRMMREEEQLFNQRLLAMAGAQYAAAEEEEEADGGDHAAGEAPNYPDVDQMSYEALLAVGEMAGHVSRGASDAALKTLKMGCYSRCGSAEEEEQCAVCRMEFETGDDTATLPCSHFYHPDCINQWLKINKACPVCNHEVTLDETDA